MHAVGTACLGFVVMLGRVHRVTASDCVSGLISTSQCRRHALLVLWFVTGRHARFKAQGVGVFAGWQGIGRSLAVLGLLWEASVVQGGMHGKASAYCGRRWQLS
jgi:hypothetical protein